jgi:hypothetical protein
VLFNGPSGETQTLGLVVPNHAFYQLNYTRIFTFLHDTTARGKNKVFSVCGHLCGQRRFCAAFGNRWKSCKRRHRKALRRFASPYPGYRHGTPKASALPTALIPDLGFEFCARCGQTCGHGDFLTTSACGGSACIADVSRDRGHGIFRLALGASCSQSRRATNCATPRYEVRRPGWAYSPKPGAIPTSLYPDTIDT